MAGTLSFWVWSPAILGWLYSLLAWGWPRLVHPNVIRRAVRQADGYHLGRTHYWQLRGRTALLLALAACLPILASRVLPLTATVVTTMLFTFVQLGMWLSAPPGRRLSILERPDATGTPLFILLPADVWWRAPLMLLGCGLLPACLLSWIVHLAIQ